MKDFELAKILRDMYDCAERNEAVCKINLFGIIYEKELRECGVPLKEIVEKSGIKYGYIAEISKGIKLSKYVSPKTKIGGENK